MKGFPWGKLSRTHPVGLGLPDEPQSRSALWRNHRSKCVIGGTAGRPCPTRCSVGLTALPEGEGKGVSCAEWECVQTLGFPWGEGFGSSGRPSPTGCSVKCNSEFRIPHYALCIMNYEFSFHARTNPSAQSSTDWFASSFRFSAGTLPPSTFRRFFISGLA